MRITIDLPTPKHEVNGRGFKALTDFDAYERSHADRPVISFLDEDYEVDKLEEFALALLWLVRNHYQGYGLECEVS